MTNDNVHRPVDVKVINLNDPGDSIEPPWIVERIKFRCTAEEAISHIAKNVLGLRFLSTCLFGLRTAKGNWLLPNTVIHDIDNKCCPLQFRLRFKLHYPERLRQVDEKALLYYYYQIRNDFLQGALAIETIKDQYSKWYLPARSMTQLSPEQIEQKRAASDVVTRLASLNMFVDKCDKGKSEKDVLKNVIDYLPKESMGILDRLLGTGKTKETAEGTLKSLAGKSSMSAKIGFLDLLELKSDLMMETFEGKLHSEGSVPIQIRVRPPFKSKTQMSADENEAVMEIQEFVSRANDSKKKAHHDERRLMSCLLSDLSHATTGLNEHFIQLFRKNGVPLTVEMSSQEEIADFKSLICGYYRLSEKWSFTLCSDIIYPSLQFLLSNSIHGPVTNEFIAQKFATKGPGRNYPYLLQQDPQNHHQINLHYSHDNSRKILAIKRLADEDKYVISHELEEVKFNSMKDLIKALKSGKFQSIQISDCLYPSEFDRDSQLLLCHLLSKSDELNRCQSDNDSKMVVNFNHLSQVKNHNIRNGRFTIVTMAVWRGHPDGRPRNVALKQLQPEFKETKLASFSQMCYDVLMWNEGTLIKSYGICLNTLVNPMTLVMEHYPLGTLDNYLQHHDLENVELLEACVSLSRALWFLDENKIVHGNIRCSNVFVAERTTTAFRVKLGDQGMFDAYDLKEVHWLPTEILEHNFPWERKLATSRSDVWAVATTFWEIFSNGDQPMANSDLKLARKSYMNGERLGRPSKLTNKLLPVYTLMKSCWDPSPEKRMDPQTLMRDTNQILFKVFNSRHFHTYLTIEDDFIGPSATEKKEDDVLGHNTAETSPSVYSVESEATNTTLVSQSDHDQKSSKPVRGATLHEDLPFEHQLLVPMFTDASRRKDSGCDSPLNGNSRPDSSMSGSLFPTNLSQFTSQTSLNSYSMNSIYCLKDDSQLEYDETAPLGEGNFGVVFKGVLTRTNGQWEAVAIKKLKETHNPIASEEMQRELEIMMSLQHENIVTLKGILNESPEVLIIMEYLQDGSLDRYLHTHRHSIDYPRQLFSFAFNVIEGMTYLASRGIIHRDLAARNILVANEDRVKISDFGLARYVDNDEYVMCSNVNIPVKWLALECLTQKTFSFASDVWSFGVTLWEMFTFGESPFLDGCENFFKAGATERQNYENLQIWKDKLVNGVRPPMPKGCPSLVYTSLMMPCWHASASKRPTFNELKFSMKEVELKVT